MSQPQKAHTANPQGGALDELRDEATDPAVRDQMDRQTLKEAADNADSEQGTGKGGATSSGDVKN